MNTEVTTLKVSSCTRPSSTAGAVAGMIREGHTAAVQAIGIGAVYRAVKAVVRARAFLQRDGIDIVCIPTFSTFELNGLETTAVRLEVVRR